MDGYKEIAQKIGAVFLICLVASGLLLWRMLLLPVFHSTTNVAIAAANSSQYVSHYKSYIGGLKMVPLILVTLLPMAAGFYWIWRELRTPIK
jgi:hypothetical protein